MRKNKKKNRKKYPVEYQINVNGCVITFKDVNAKRYKHIELCLKGIAKLLNVVRDSDDWEKFIALMEAVATEMAENSLGYSTQPMEKPPDYVR